MPQPIEALSQLSCLAVDLARLVNGKPHRWLTIWFGGSAGVVTSYRIDRMLYLAIGRAYVVLRPLVFPVFLFLRLLGGRHEISYHADIGRGLCIFHPSLGVVVSAKTISGANLTLVGGNCIGSRKNTATEGIRLGSNVCLGVNAVVLGPCILGDNVQIGAGAVVLGDLPRGACAVGVPARIVTQPELRYE